MRVFGCVTFSSRDFRQEREMASLEVLGAWWTTLRVPAVAVLVFIWILLARRQNVTSERNPSAEDIKLDPVPSQPRVDKTPKLVRNEENVPVVKRDSKPPKKFTRHTLKTKPSIPGDDVSKGSQ